MKSAPPVKGATRDTKGETTEKRLRLVSDAPLPAFTISRFMRVNYGSIVAQFTVSIAHVDIAFMLTMPDGKPPFASPAKIKDAYRGYRATTFVTDDLAGAVLLDALARYKRGEGDGDE